MDGAGLAQMFEVGRYAMGRRRFCDLGWLLDAAWVGRRVVSISEAQHQPIQNKENNGRRTIIQDAIRPNLFVELNCR